MINYQDKSASDDAARLAAHHHCKVNLKTRKQTTPEKMADLFCSNFARNLPTTENDLWMEGFTDEEIRTHLPEARRLARERTNTAA